MRHRRHGRLGETRLDGACGARQRSPNVAAVSVKRSPTVLRGGLEALDDRSNRATRLAS